MQKDFEQKFCNHILNIKTFKNKQAKYSKQNGNLFLGGVNCLKPQLLKNNNINAVLTIMGDFMIHKNKVKQKLKQANIQTHKVCQLDDDQAEDISVFFDQSYQFIYQNLQNGNVLVHCQVGASRSATLVIAFVMKCFNMKHSDAYFIVKKRRKQINPNIGFVNALDDYEKKIKGQQIISPIKAMKQHKQKPKLKKRKNYTHILSIFGSQETQKGNLFLGGIWAFEQNIYQDNIFAVLSVLNKQKMDIYLINNKIEAFAIQNHKWLDKQDIQDQDLLSHFQQTYDFLIQNLNKTNVLVHCQAGVSRSASFVIAFIMKYKKMPFKNALNLVKGKRSLVMPNEGFQSQLMTFQQQLINQGKL